MKPPRSCFPPQRSHKVIFLHRTDTHETHTGKGLYTITVLLSVSEMSPKATITDSQEYILAKGSQIKTHGRGWWEGDTPEEWGGWWEGIPRSDQLGGQKGSLLRGQGREEGTPDNPWGSSPPDATHIPSGLCRSRFVTRPLPPPRGAKHFATLSLVKPAKIGSQPSFREGGRKWHEASPPFAPQNQWSVLPSVLPTRPLHGTPRVPPTNLGPRALPKCALS